MKRNTRLIEEFENASFQLPFPQLSIESATRKSLLRNEQNQALQMTITNLCSELRKVTDESTSLKEQLFSLQKKTSVRNLHKREKRKLKRLSMQRRVISDITLENKHLTTKLKKVEKSLRKSEQKCAMKLSHCRQRYNPKRLRYKSQLQHAMRKVHNSMDTDTASDSESFISDDGEDGTFSTYDKGHYTAKVRECCMQLLAYNVGISNIEPCIKAVCDLVGCKPDRLPSKSTLANMMVEAQAISHLQIADCVPSFSTNMLHSDGTTKFGEKYGGLQITTPDSCYTLCLTSMKAGGANDFKQLLVDALSDIACTCQAVSKNGTEISNRILVSIKNTMSDRHIVEKKFNELLESYRTGVLPDIIQGWDDFTEEQQLSFSRVNNFFCGLHFLVGLADAAAETLKMWEQLHTDKESDSKATTEAGTLRLIRSACKAVQKQCSQQAGCHLVFKEYLKAQGVTVFPIAKFQGNRFNIIFYNAAGVFYVRSHLTRYLGIVHENPNRLLQAVLQDLKNPFLVVGCRALGIVSKCITGPLWRLLESTKTMSELGKVYQKMHRCLLRWSADASDLLAGNSLEGEADRDCIFNDLLQPSDEDELVCELLQLLCKSFWLVADRMLGDHLEDGIYSEMSAATLNKESVNLPMTNVCSERDFALLDRYFKLYYFACSSLLV